MAATSVGNGLKIGLRSQGDGVESGVGFFRGRVGAKMKLQIILFWHSLEGILHFQLE